MPRNSSRTFSSSRSHFDLPHVAGVHALPHSLPAVVPGRTGTVDLFLSGDLHQVSALAPEHALQERHRPLCILDAFILSKPGLHREPFLGRHEGFVLSKTHGPLLRRLRLVFFVFLRRPAIDDHADGSVPPFHAGSQDP